MEERKERAQRNIKNAGLAAFIIGWLGVLLGVVLLVVSILFFVSNDYTNTGLVFGIFFLAWSVAAIALSIVQILGGMQLQKLKPNSKGWLAFLIVAGVLDIISFGAGLTLISGIVLIVFAIIALSSVDDASLVSAKNDTKSK